MKEMKSTIPEKLATNKTKLVRELVQGQELAKQLLNFLTSPSRGCDFAVLPQEIVARILSTFTNSLSIMNCESNDVQDLGSCDDQRSEGSSESRKRPAAKDKRGCYKRRKDAQTWTTVTPTLEDGQAWRKYGQKEIHNSKFPRAYFRCTRKYDQGCNATKQVQKMEDDPKMYHTTYIGVHTCKDMLKAPQIITEDSNPYWKSCIVFSSDQSKNVIPTEKELDFSTCTTTLAVKQEPSSREETGAAAALSDLTTDNNNTSSMDSMFWPPDLDTTLMSPNVGSVYSCTDTSSHMLGFDDFVGSEDFTSNYFPFY